jgi:dTDP-4-dehydrorhamnose 3,5-epimerase
MINGVIITPLKIISTPRGDVFHAMKKSDEGFKDYGEAYFSEIRPNEIKAWKRHRRMTLNLIVPHGQVRFVLADLKENSQQSFQEIILSRQNYCRLTIPPMIWFGFQGISKTTSLVLNIADLMHDSEEVDRINILDLKFDWT